MILVSRGTPVGSSQVHRGTNSPDVQVSKPQPAHSFEVWVGEERGAARWLGFAVVVRAMTQLKAFRCVCVWGGGARVIHLVSLSFKF